MSFTESNYENAIIALFRDTLGYAHIYGPDVSREYADPFYVGELLPALRRVNPDLPEAALSEAVYKLRNFEGDLLQKNIAFMDYLQNGVSVNYFDGSEQRSVLVHLVDYLNVERNIFAIANQWTIVEKSEKRPDIIIFLNGLPVVVFELKSPSREETDASEAFNQLRNYMREIPSLFIYNAFLVMSDFAVSKAGTITAGEDRFMEWKTKDGSYENIKYASFDTFFEGIFEKARLLDIIKNFICFSGDVKIIGAYHQYFAVRKAAASTVKAMETDGKGGVFWHTQGSGKSLSMVFYARLLQEVLNSPTIVVLTDRNDLDEQLFEQFAKCKDFLRQVPEKAESRGHLKELLENRQANGIIFSTVQKFHPAWSNEKHVCSNHVGADGNMCISNPPAPHPSSPCISPPVGADGNPPVSSPKGNMCISASANPPILASTLPLKCLSNRKNIVVIADEAHRSQFIDEKVDSEGRRKKTFGLIIRESLPNAVYIGFTGTPISSKDRSTVEVFGDCIDIYDMTQAVEDGATRPVYYESRVIHLKLDEEILRLIDAEYDILAQNAEPYAIEKSKKELSRMESILGAEQTVAALCNDIIEHYEKTRWNELTGKAMIVAYSRPIAMSIYHKILQLRPGWAEKIGVVMTSGNSDPEEWREVIGNKQYKEEMARKFKDNNDPLKIAIVVDMWLTGFDVPSLATMYVYKPMSGHNLMQAIARVNRVYKDKEGGLVVDYVGIAGALKQAMNDYTNRDKDNYGDPDIAKTAYPKFKEKMEVCRDLFHGFDYSYFMNEKATDLDRARLISGGANFLSAIKTTPAGAEGNVCISLPMSPHVGDDGNRPVSSTEWQYTMVAEDPIGADMYDADVKRRRATRNRDLFIKEASLLRQALSLCRSLVTAKERFEAAYFEAVWVMLARVTGDGKPLSVKEINAHINELLKASIHSMGVINLFSDINTDFSLFSPKFLEEISQMKERNLAIEILKKLLAEQLKLYRRTNLVKSEKFSEQLAQCMKRYINGLISNEEVIAELMKIAKDMATAHEEGCALGLSDEELAFYDALTRPNAMKDFYQNEELIAMTRELTETLRKNRTIDWHKKESARASMRRMVKKLLEKYKYPPEGREDALKTVIKQCEMWVSF